MQCPGGYPADTADADVRGRQRRTGAQVKEADTTLGTADEPLAADSHARDGRNGRTRRGVCDQVNQADFTTRATAHSDGIAVQFGDGEMGYITVDLRHMEGIGRCWFP